MGYIDEAGIDKSRNERGDSARPGRKKYKLWCSSEVSDWIESVSAKFDTLAYYFDALEHHGPEWGAPHVEVLTPDLWALNVPRVQTGTAVCFSLGPKDGQIVLLRPFSWVGDELEAVIADAESTRRRLASEL